MTIKKCIYIVLFLCAGFPAAAQLSEFYPDVGDRMPEFTLHNVRFSDKRTVSSEQLKGRHVILDFFTAGCSACFEALPKVNRIQNDNKSDLDIFMVGWDTYGLSSTYLNFREKLKLEMAVSYDSLMFRQFSVTGVPYLIWIDDKGIIQAITSSSEMNEANVAAFLKNRPFPARNYNIKRWKAAIASQDTAYILRLSQYAASKSVMAGTFVAWNSSMPMSDNQETYHYIGGNAYYQIMGLPLYQYINFAYTGRRLPMPRDSIYGKIFTKPVYEMDSVDIPVDDYDSSKSMFCYSMITDGASATQDKLAESLRGDLKTRLGLEISMESRMMPCWVVTARPGTAERLKSKYDSTGIEVNKNSSLHLQHRLPNSIFYLLFGIDQDAPPFIDETGLTGFIDLDLEVLITDFSDVKKELDKIGIVVTPGRRLMKVLVVRKQRDKS